MKPSLPRTLPVVLGWGCSTCGAVPLQVALCSSLTDDAWSLCFPATADLLKMSASLLSCPSPLLFPAVLPPLSLWLAWPLRFFFSQVPLIPAGSSLSVDPAPPSLMCFLALLADFFSGLAGINRGDDGHELMLPAREEKRNLRRGKKCFVGRFVLNQSSQIKGWASCQKMLMNKL